MSDGVIQMANLMSPLDIPQLTRTAPPFHLDWSGLLFLACLSQQVGRQLDRKMLRRQCEPVRHSVDLQLLFPHIHLLMFFLILMAQKN